MLKFGGVVSLGLLLSDSLLGQVDAVRLNRGKTSAEGTLATRNRRSKSRTSAPASSTWDQISHFMFDVPTSSQSAVLTVDDKGRVSKIQDGQGSTGLTAGGVGDGIIFFPNELEISRGGALLSVEGGIPLTKQGGDFTVSIGVRAVSTVESQVLFTTSTGLILSLEPSAAESKDAQTSLTGYFKATFPSGEVIRSSEVCLGAPSVVSFAVRKSLVETATKTSTVFSANWFRDGVALSELQTVSTETVKVVAKVDETGKGGNVEFAVGGCASPSPLDRTLTFNPASTPAPVEEEITSTSTEAVVAAHTASQQVEVAVDGSTVVEDHAVVHEDGVSSSSTSSTSTTTIAPVEGGFKPSVSVNETATLEADLAALANLRAETAKSVHVDVVSTSTTTVSPVAGGFKASVSLSDIEEVKNSSADVSAEATVAVPTRDATVHAIPNAAITPGKFSPSVSISLLQQSSHTGQIVETTNCFVGRISSIVIHQEGLDSDQIEGVFSHLLHDGNLAAVRGAGICGDGIVNGNEECDASNDASCACNCMKVCPTFPQKAFEDKGFYVELAPLSSSPGSKGILSCDGAKGLLAHSSEGVATATSVCHKGKWTEPDLECNPECKSLDLVVKSGSLAGKGFAVPPEFITSSSVSEGTRSNVTCAEGYLPSVSALLSGIQEEEEKDPSLLNTALDMINPLADKQKKEVRNFATLTCTAGKWSLPTISCHKTCGAYTPPAEEGYEIVDHPTVPVHHGDSLVLTCASGFNSLSLKSAKDAPLDTVTCIDGKWTQTALMCEPSCPPFPSLAATYTAKATSGGAISSAPGSEVEVSCGANSAPPAGVQSVSQKLSCRAGKWTPLSLKCEPLCDTFIPSGEVVVTPTANNTANLSDANVRARGSRLTVACKNGFASRSGAVSEEIVCGAKGWTSPLLKCEALCEDAAERANSKGVAFPVASKADGFVGASQGVVCDSQQGYDTYNNFKSADNTLVVENVCGDKAKWIGPNTQACAPRCPAFAPYAASHGWLKERNIRLVRAVEEIDQQTVDSPLQEAAAAVTAASFVQFHSTVSVSEPIAASLNMTVEELTKPLPTTTTTTTVVAAANAAPVAATVAEEGKFLASVSVADAATAAVVGETVTATDDSTTTTTTAVSTPAAAATAAAVVAEPTLETTTTTTRVVVVGGSTVLSLADSPQAQGFEFEIECIEGYAALDGRTKETLRCLAGGEWQEPTLKCFKQCEDLTTLGSGFSVSGEGVFPGAQRRVSCANDHATADGKKEEIVTCQDGSWGVPALDCQSSCAAPWFLQDGSAYTLVDGASLPTGVITHGTTAEIKCKSATAGSSKTETLSCLGGTWTAVTLSCGVACPNPSSVETLAKVLADEKFLISNLPSKTEELKDGVAFTVACNAPAYSATSSTASATVTCHGGAWYPPTVPVTCQAGCGAFPEVPASHVVETDPINTNARIAKCAPGYSPKSATQKEVRLVCQDGHWPASPLPLVLPCEASCPAPVAPKGFKLVSDQAVITAVQQQTYADASPEHAGQVVQAVTPAAVETVQEAKAVVESEKIPLAVALIQVRARRRAAGEEVPSVKEVAAVLEASVASDVDAPTTVVTTAPVVADVASASEVASRSTYLDGEAVAVVCENDEHNTATMVCSGGKWVAPATQCRATCSLDGERSKILTGKTPANMGFARLMTIEVDGKFELKPNFKIVRGDASILLGGAPAPHRHGESVTLTCADGYTATNGVTEETVGCHDGFFNVPLISCEPQCPPFADVLPKEHCPDGPTADNCAFRIEGEGRVYGSERVVSCAPGFSPLHTFTDDANAYVTSTQATASSQAVRSEAAALFDVSICAKAGVWTPLAIECVPDCQAPVLPSGLQLASVSQVSSFPQGSIANVKCAAGFAPAFASAPETVTISCLASGKWTTPSLACYPLCQSNPSLQDNTKLLTRQLDGTPLGWMAGAERVAVCADVDEEALFKEFVNRVVQQQDAVVTAAAQAAVQTPVDPVVITTEAETSTTTVAAAIPVNKDVERVVDAIVATAAEAIGANTTTTHEAVVSSFLQTKVSKKLASSLGVTSETLRCRKDNGQFTSSFFGCRGMCEPFVPSADSRIEVSTQTDLYALLKCADNTAPLSGDGTEVLRCQTDGTWSSVELVCSKACEAVKDISELLSGDAAADAKLKDLTLSVDASGAPVLQCKSGLLADVAFPSGDHKETLVCNRGTWSRPSLSCHLPCAELPSTSSVNITAPVDVLTSEYSTEEAHGKARHGARRVQSCRDGYTAVQGQNGEVAVCSNGVWTGAHLECRAGCASPSSGLIAHGGHVTLSCNAGQAAISKTRRVVAGSKSSDEDDETTASTAAVDEEWIATQEEDLACLDGHLVPPTLVCADDCPALDKAALELRNFKIVEWKNDVAQGAKAKIGCRDGYTPADLPKTVSEESAGEFTETLRCANSKWDMPDLRCEPKCARMPEIVGLKVDYNPTGQLATISCAAGYQPNVASGAALVTEVKCLGGQFPALPFACVPSVLVSVATSEADMIHHPPLGEDVNNGNAGSHFYAYRAAPVYDEASKTFAYPVGDHITEKRVTSGGQTAPYMSLLVTGNTRAPTTWRLVFASATPTTASDKLAPLLAKGKPESLVLSVGQKDNRTPVPWGASIWEPIAPEGFVCLGYAVSPTHQPPSKDTLRCVPAQCVQEVTQTQLAATTPLVSSGFVAYATSTQEAAKAVLTSVGGQRASDLVDKTIGVSFVAASVKDAIPKAAVLKQECLLAASSVSPSARVGTSPVTQAGAEAAISARK